MGGGNGMKSKTKRDRQGSKKPDVKGGQSQLTKNKAAMNIICQMCRQSFMCTLSEKSLMEHVNSKHPKNDMKQCFPSQLRKVLR